jgi:hypothetical protein
MFGELIQVLWVLPAFGLGVVAAVGLGAVCGPPTRSPDGPSWCADTGCANWICRRALRDWDHERLAR